MPAALNLQPRKRASIAGMLRHDFRRYDPEAMPSRIDPERVALNRTLCGSPEALDDLPLRQPDTGRKIRKDANVAASFVCTLPIEIHPRHHTLRDAWVDTTVEWLRTECPGDVAYAVLHLDESRPHIHAAIIPRDRNGHLSYKEFFSGRQKLRDLQKSYSGALQWLGVEENSELVKAARAAQYTRGIDGWRVGGITHEIATREKALETGLEQQAAGARPFISLPAPKRAESARRYRERVSPVIHAQMHARVGDALLAKHKSEAAARMREGALQAKLGHMERLLRQLQQWKRAALHVLAPEQRTRIREYLTKGRAPKERGLER